MYKTIEFVFLLLNIPKKNSAGCAMIFCNEMSPRVEEQFCKNICFLGIDTNYCSDLYTVHVFDSTQSSDSCFGYFRNHSDDTAKCKTPFHGSFLGLQAPCHFVRHSPSFMAAILSSISFWIWWRQRSKNTKFQKVAKKRNPYKSCLKINETGEKNREPEVVALQNDSRYQKCYSI